MPEIFRYTVTETERRMRLDEFLFDKIREVSRMHLRNLILKEKCLLNGEKATAGIRLKVADEIEVEVDLSAETSMLPENIPLEIVFEDAEIVVVNKPAGMLVHPTKGVKKGTLLNALSYHLNHSITSDELRMTNDEEAGANDKEERTKNEQKFIRAGLIHRLDRQTSGLIAVSKTAKAHTHVTKQIQKRTVEKKYYAVVEGIVAEDSGTIDAPIYHNEEERFWVISDLGKPSESRFRVIERRADSTLLEFEPVTGRTNQLRLHAKHIGHPIIGDTIYGGREFPRLCLHAYSLTFRHPADNQPIRFESAMPAEFNQSQ
jgi:23S rRNA pseudouridine1911/1915/1917 synthase